MQSMYSVVLALVSINPLTDYQTVEHILSHYILLWGVPNLTQTDWAIYHLALKTNPLDFTMSINSTCHNMDVRNK